MALSVTAVGPVPVSVVLDDATATIENLGDRPLRFMVARMADEAAPEDLGAGHLLLPGARVDVKRAAEDAPLWVWSDRPTRIGVAARLN